MNNSIAFRYVTALGPVVYFSTNNGLFIDLVMMDENGFPGWLSLMHLILATLMFIALAFATVIAHEALKE